MLDIVLLPICRFHWNAHCIPTAALSFRTHRTTLKVSSVTSGLPFQKESTSEMGEAELKTWRCCTSFSAPLPSLGFPPAPPSMAPASIAQQIPLFPTASKQQWSLLPLCLSKCWISATYFRHYRIAKLKFQQQQENEQKKPQQNHLSSKDPSRGGSSYTIEPLTLSHQIGWHQITELGLHDLNFDVEKLEVSKTISEASNGTIRDGDLQV